VAESDPSEKEFITDNERWEGAEGVGEDLKIGRWIPLLLWPSLQLSGIICSSQNIFK
jgi:hypothetical protein